MTRIERVDVEGFKGIESLAVEPSGINIVTGRNNTGKTSLLEAIQLAFDPGAIKRFEDNIGQVINREYEQAILDIETEDKEQKIEIQSPDRGQVREILVEGALMSVSEFVNYLDGQYDSEIKVSDSSYNELREIAISLLSTDFISEVSDLVIILHFNEKVYPFIVPVENVRRFYFNVLDEAIGLLSEKNIPGVEKQLSDAIAYMITRSDSGSYDILPNFIETPPSATGTVTFVDIPDPTTQPEPKDDEASAIKIDDIEDFLIEHEILENLRDFDLDYLVFEDEDGVKYSVPYDFMGDGFKAIVGILWELLDDDLSGNVVLLEEPGTHMHPGYVRELVYFLVNLAREEDVQLFITTHDNDFISDFFTENLTDGEREFLEEEFTLVQMQEDAADVMGYEEAEEQLKELHLDLRGL